MYAGWCDSSLIARVCWLPSLSGLPSHLTRLECRLRRGCRGGRVGVAFRDKEEAIEAFLGKCERWYEDMRFTLPHCETDYTGYYCLRFDNIGTERYRATEEDVRGDFEKFGEVVDVRGAGLFDVRNTEVYVRFREKSSAQHALTSLNGR